MLKKSATCFVLVLSVSSSLTHGEERYPNELERFPIIAKAKWREIEFFKWDYSKIDSLFGDSSESLVDRATPGWKTIFLMWGEANKCNGKPYPDSIANKIMAVELIPISTISVVDVEFSKEFEVSHWVTSHAKVGLSLNYKDGFGLSYSVFSAPSTDGAILKGDLKSITYGPDDSLYNKMTRCDGNRNNPRREY